MQAHFRAYFSSSVHYAKARTYEAPMSSALRHLPGIAKEAPWHRRIWGELAAMTTSCSIMHNAHSNVIRQPATWQYDTQRFAIRHLVTATFCHSDILPIWHFGITMLCHSQQCATPDFITLQENTPLWHSQQIAIRQFAIRHFAITTLCYSDISHPCFVIRNLPFFNRPGVAGAVLQTP